MSHESWIDRQVREAERRGVFENLPGTGRPLPIRPGSGDGDYGQAWLRDYAMREGVPAEELLPAPLRLRREAERLAAEVPDLPSEDAVREAVSDLNRRIVDWRRFPDGPPIHVRLVNKDEMLARWHQARAGRPAPPPAEERSAPRRSWLPWRRR